MPLRRSARATLSALLALAALAFQAALPGLHPQHGAAALNSVRCAVASHDAPVVQHAVAGGAAHDALTCELCATIAQGRAGATAAAPIVPQALASLDVAPPLVTRLLAAPALTRAAPRAPPVLA
jgi:hypothetical protein